MRRRLRFVTIRICLDLLSVRLSGGRRSDQKLVRFRFHFFAPSLGASPFRGMKLKIEFFLGLGSSDPSLYPIYFNLTVKKNLFIHLPFFSLILKELLVVGVFQSLFRSCTRQRILAKNFYFGNSLVDYDTHCRLW